MPGRTGFEAEWSELEQVDYFLDHLARAVERGEVPRQSYDLLAPRYLKRRNELVSVLAGPSASLKAQASAAADSLPPSASGAVPFAEDAFPVARIGRAPIPTPRAARVRPSRRVEWTTILLFLGAFLVIVAASIFAVAVWDILAVEGKLAFLGALTLGFYAAGAWARTRLKLAAGSVALLAVASAMLLLVGWVAIDGYSLEGPLPWAVLLLVCSAAYWLTEVWLAEKFFGVIGAAAQIGWWWLLGQGLGWSPSFRFAGLAVVALLWDLAAERARGDRTLASLATALLWCAPILSLAASVGVLWSAAIAGAGKGEVVAGAVAGVSGLVVLGRSRLDLSAARWTLAALLQLPMALAATATLVASDYSWGALAALLVAAVCYEVAGVVWAGAPLAVAGLVTETLLVIELARLLGANSEVTLLALGGLAAGWALAARAARSPRMRAIGERRVAEVARCAEIGAFVLLVACSFALLPVTGAIALAADSFAASAALTALGLMAAWSLAALALPFTLVHWGAAAFSFYAFASLAAWLLPGRPPAEYATGMAALASAWLFSTLKGASSSFAAPARWASRFVLLSVGAAGLYLQHSGMGAIGASLEAAVLALAVALAFFGDAVAFESAETAGASSLFLVLAGFEAAGTLASGPADAALSAALGAAIASLAVAAVAALATLRAPRRSAVGATVASAAGIALALAAAPQAAGLAAALGVCSLTWLVALRPVGQTAAGAAAATVLGALVAALAALRLSPWVAVAVLGAYGLLLASCAVLGVFGRDGRFRTAGTLLGAVGALAQVVLILFGSVSAALPVQEWWAVGRSGLAAGLALLGAGLLLQALFRKAEPLWYAGFAALTAGILVVTDLLGATQLEFFTTPVSVYLAGMGYLFVALEPGREHPVLLDVATLAIGLGLPLMNALGGGAPETAMLHAVWVVGLSLVSICAGIALKARSYLFAGSAAIAAVALYRSFVALAPYWWLLLGFVGVVMLVVALTWESQRLVVSQTRERLRESFTGWR